MAAKIIPSGGLSAASNPSARLQELLRNSSAPEQKNTEKSTDTHTEIIAEENTPLLTEINTLAHPQGNTEPIAAAHAESLSSPRTQRRKPVKLKASVPKKVEASASTNTSVPSNTSVRQRIVEDLQKEPVVRKTIDIPASLNERLQDYCAAKRIKTERRVFLVLLENFLEEEGF